MKKYLILFLTFISMINATELSLGFSGNNRGAMMPCDCTIPAGGLARISTVVNNIKNDHIQVGAGNHFFHHTPMKYDNQIHEQKKAFLQAQLMSEMNYSVVNVGQFDLCYGLKPLYQIQDNFGLDLISANIVDLNDSHPFPAFKIIEYNDLKIMFIGICQYTNEMNFKILDPLKTLIELSNEGVFDEADLVILLADATSKVILDFITYYKGVDIVIASKEHRNTMLPMRFKNTDLIQLGSQGKYFAKLDLRFENSDHSWTDLSQEHAHISEIHQELSLSNENQKTLRNKMKNLKKKLRRQIKQHPNNYYNNMIFLDDGINDDIAIKDRIESLTEGKK